jgi:hypothetical protein
MRVWLAKVFVPDNRDDAMDRILADIGDMRRQLELLRRDKAGVFVDWNAF